jgi:hypothetical protein
MATEHFGSIRLERRLDRPGIVARVGRALGQYV